MTLEQLSNTCRRFALIAVERGFISAEQAKSALAQQMDEDLANEPHRVIGAILMYNGWITAERIDSVLNELFPRAY